MNGSRFFRSNRTVRFGFQNLARQDKHLFLLGTRQYNISIDLPKTHRGNIPFEPGSHGALPIPPPSVLRNPDGLACIPTVEYTRSHDILRVLHSCPPIWKELACHAQRPYYIFVFSQYGKKCLRFRGLNSKSSLQRKILHSRDLSQLYTTI